MLDAIPISSVFQSALSNDIVVGHPELWFRLRFLIMDDAICYDFRITSIAQDALVKSYSPQSLSSFKPFLELYFNRIIPAHMLRRLFKTSVQQNACNVFLGLLVYRICPLLSMCRIGWLVSRSCSDSCSFKR